MALADRSMALKQERRKNQDGAEMRKRIPFPVIQIVPLLSILLKRGTFYNFVDASYHPSSSHTGDFKV